MERIVFLERHTLRASLRRPSFEHTMRYYDDAPRPRAAARARREREEEAAARQPEVEPELTRKRVNHV